MAPPTMRGVTLACCSLLAIATDALLQLISRKAFPWAHGDGK